MTTFWLLFAALLVLACAFVLWPLLRNPAKTDTGIGVRDELVVDLFRENLNQLQGQQARGEISEQEFELLQRELELSLLQDSGTEASAKGKIAPGKRLGWVSAGLAVVIVIATSVVLYMERGAIGDVDIVAKRSAYFTAPADANGDNKQQLKDLIDALLQRLQKKPDNMGNRYLLARSYMQQSDYIQAVKHYTYIAQNDEPSAMIIGELAQAVFLAMGSRITPEVETLVARALELDPREATSLGLAGISAFEQQAYAQAIGYWQRAVAELGPGTAGAASLQAGIARARTLLEQAGQDKPVAEAANRAQIEVSVELASHVDAAPTDTVFIYARAWQGAKVPLAITRLTVADLPVRVTLDESMAMAAGMTITSAEQLELLARVSATGQPVAQSGDWQASEGPVVLQDLAEPVSLIIGQRLP